MLPTSLLDPWFVFLADDPFLRSLQAALLLLGALAVFLVFFTTRDILLRSNSFLYMFFSIALVAILPFVGFLLYLLVRPARTIKEREVETMLTELLSRKPAQATSKVTSEEKPTTKAKKASSSKVS